MRIDTYYKLNESWRVNNNPSTLYSSAIQKILQESKQQKPQILEEGVLDLVKSVGKELKIATKFITTFGTGVGALYPAVIRFLNNSSISLNKQEVMLLTITAISIAVHDPEANRLKQIVKEKDLNKALTATLELIKNISKIIGSSMTDMLGYTSLLVPTVNAITELIDKQHVGMHNVQDLFKGLAASASAYGIKTLIDKTKDNK
ncbi:MAG: hypothetical protein VKL39_24395 [Leptolyngbyaceae bacterium]|nr:hypothetical protein [Leptolyngbyaceae bacterium]